MYSYYSKNEWSAALLVCKWLPALRVANPALSSLSSELLNS
jgi:hypothetical protein